MFGVMIQRRLPRLMIKTGCVGACVLTLLLSYQAIFDSTSLRYKGQRLQPSRVIYRLVSPGNQSHHQVLPNATVLRSLSWPLLAEQYHRYIENIQTLCTRMVRVGNLKDGGWEVCDDVAYRPRTPCLIYSFGIKNDFSFDDEAARRYGCHVHSFDPSTKMHDHQRSMNVTFHATGLADFDGYKGAWRMRRLGTIRDELDHKMTELSILKIDVEEWEWPSLPEALTSGALDDVSQLLVEFHLTIKPQPRQARYLHSLLLLRHLYLAGFRTFYTSRNLHCAFRQIFDGAHKAGCHEVNMIRVKSVKFADLDIFEDR